MFDPTLETDSQRLLVEQLGLGQLWDAYELAWARDTSGALWLVARAGGDWIAGPVGEDIVTALSEGQTLGEWWAELTS